MSGLNPSYCWSVPHLHPLHWDLTFTLSVSLYVLPNLSAWPLLRSLILRIKLQPEAIRRIIEILGGPTLPSTIREVAIEASSDTIAQLHLQCCQLAKTKLLEILEIAILRFPAPSLSLSARSACSLSSRKSISWREELGKFFPALQERRALTISLQFCECFCGLRRRTRH